MARSERPMSRWISLVRPPLIELREIRCIKLIGRNAQKATKRNQIVEAAARVFSRSGYSNAVVADIALQANIGKGTIYEYFKSKEALFFAVFEWFQKKTEQTAAVEISALGGDATHRLKALNDSLMGQWDELKDVFVLVMVVYH